MGTDRIHEFSCPCDCGSGSYQIDYCTPDHAWPVARQEWYEANVRCPVCSEQYELRRFGRGFFRVAIAGLKAKEAKTQELNAAVSALEAAAKAKGLHAALISAIDQQPSAAAKHRFLAAAGLEHLSLPTFRKRWSGAPAWLQSNFSGYQVSKVMQALGTADAELSEAAAKVSALHAESNSAPAPVGTAIYILDDA